LFTISKNSLRNHVSGSLPVLMSPLAGLEIALAIPPVNMRRRNMAANAPRGCVALRNSACEPSAMDAKALGERRSLQAPYAQRLSDGLALGSR
jgi:hypothetical protein